MVQISPGIKTPSPASKVCGMIGSLLPVPAGGRQAYRADAVSLSDPLPRAQRQIPGSPHGTSFLDKRLFQMIRPNLLILAEIRFPDNIRHPRLDNLKSIFSR